MSRPLPKATPWPSKASARRRFVPVPAWLRQAWTRLSAAWLPVLLVPTAIVVGILVEEPLLPPTGYPAFGYQSIAVWVPGNALVGWSTIAAGLAAWFYRPDLRVGRLLTAAGFAWFLGAASWASSDGGAFQGYYILFISALVLTYPSERLGGGVARLILVSMAVTVVASTIGRLALLHGMAFFGNCDPTDPTCAPSPDTVDFSEIPWLGTYDWLDSVYRLLLGLETVGVLAVVMRRFVGSSRAKRRVLLPPVAMAVALTAAIGLAVARRSDGFDASVADTFLVGVVIALAVLPHAITWDHVRGRLSRSVVADLVVQLAEPSTRNILGASLGRALGDPSLVVLTWSPEAGAYIDESGVVAALPAHGSRAVTLLTRDGGSVGALVHDPAVRANPGLLDSVSAAAALAIDNTRLAAAVRAQMDELRASRARIVAAAVEERQRLERDLHDGAQQQLVALAIALRAARGRVDGSADPALARSLADASERADSAIVELRELARGIHPPVLTEAGLTAALSSLAARAAVPVTVDAALPERLPPAVETTAYFVVAEALTNVAKHAHARRAHVRAEVLEGQLRVTVDDDGAGGADLTRGTGLRGLADRVAALGGSIAIETARGSGTRLVAVIPCVS